MDPILNCLLAVCCPPEARAGALAELLYKGEACDEETAKRVAELLCKYLDFAPAGLLTPLMQRAGELARGPAYKP